MTGISDSQLRGVPKYSDESSWNWSDPSVARSVDDYYRAFRLRKLSGVADAIPEPPGQALRASACRLLQLPAGLLLRRAQRPHRPFRTGSNTGI